MSTTTTTTDVAVLIRADGTIEDICARSHFEAKFLYGEVVRQFSTDDLAEVLGCTDPRNIGMTGDSDGYDRLYFDRTAYEKGLPVNAVATKESAFELHGDVVKLSYREIYEEEFGPAES